MKCTDDRDALARVIYQAWCDAPAGGYWPETVADAVIAHFEATRPHDTGLRGRVEALLDEIAADQSMMLAPGWMSRDACVAKVQAALDTDGERP